MFFWNCPTQLDMHSCPEFPKDRNLPILSPTISSFRLFGVYHSSPTFSLTQDQGLGIIRSTSLGYFCIEVHKASIIVTLHDPLMMAGLTLAQLGHGSACCVLCVEHKNSVRCTCCIVSGFNKYMRSPRWTQVIRSMCSFL